KRLSSYAEVYRQFRWAIPEHFNIGVAVCDAWAYDARRLALIYEAKDGGVQRYTFADIRRLANQTANLLHDSGIGTGDRVGILLPQAPETAVAHVAAYKLGAIA